MIALIPVKPFGVAKRRLSSRFDPAQRKVLGQAIAGHTATVAAAAGIEPWIVTGSEDVARWAGERGLTVVAEDEGGGLDGAARAGISAASGRWMVVHADLPAVVPADLAALVDAGPTAIAPSHDGGTSAVTGESATFPFAYGPGSFHRHLSARPNMTVVCRPGLAYDLDDTQDYDIITALESGRWIGDVT
ncbi:MAG: 2-phospho-L-lactate guanylyltransferase [Acidimicrobiia bacterium]|nr:2-phospho-L-lactate guanylyltransferase [Acidimicrobiia bacterium]